MNLLSLKKSRITTIVICLLIISSISVAFKLPHVDFTEPPISEDTYVYILAAFSIINGDFSQPDTKPLGWSILLSPFYLFDDSTDLLHYVNIARILSIAISTITILPMYILARRFFDEKYSLVASCLFAFEPHLINNSTLGLSEPLFILAIILTSIFILQKNHSWYFYMSFLLAGITWWIRVNGFITLVILSIIFFIVYKSSSKNFTKYLLCIVIFVLVASPMLIQKYDQFGDPLYFAISDNYFAGDQKHFALNTKHIEYSASDYIQDNGIIGFLERFGLTGLGSMASTLLKMLFPYLIILVPFGILFSLRSFAQDKDYVKSIWVLMLITLGSVVIQFSIVSDMRFIYHIFPFLIILSTITIQRVVKYGLSTFSFSDKQKNFFLIGVICVIIILSGMFMLRVDTQDKILNQERIEFTETLTKNFGGKRVGTVSFTKGPVKAECVAHKSLEGGRNYFYVVLQNGDQGWMGRPYVMRDRRGREFLMPNPLTGEEVRVEFKVEKDFLSSDVRLNTERYIPSYDSIDWDNRIPVRFRREGYSMYSQAMLDGYAEVDRLVSQYQGF